MAISLPCSRDTSRLADLDKSPRISTRAADLPRPQLTNHPAAQEDISNNDTGVKDCNRDTDILRRTQQKQESSAYVKSRRHRGIHWVGMDLTPHTMVNIANSKDGLGGRRLPEEAGFAKGASDLNKRGRECHIKDKVRQAASRSGAFNGPGHVKLSLRDKPRVT